MLFPSANVGKEFASVKGSSSHIPLVLFQGLDHGPTISYARVLGHIVNFQSL